MAAKKSNAASPSPASAVVPGAVTDDMIREAEEKVGRLEMFERSQEWVLQKTMLEARAKSLEAQSKALRRRLGRPGKDEQPVTLDAIARLEGQIEENERLLRFPDITKALWREQLAQMREIRQREA